MKKFISILGLMLVVGGFVRAQQGQYFSVLSNTTDKDGKYLYVEVMYEKPVCTDAQAMFYLKHDGISDSIPMKITVLNNDGTYTLSADSMLLSRPYAAGYLLRFTLPAGVTAAKHPRICVSSYTMAFLCSGCAAGGSDVVFALPDSKHGACPYYGDDVLACYQRTTRRGSTVLTSNWEAWIRDKRDCKAYRIVQLRNGVWWFAQNLNFTDNLSPGDTVTIGRYMCPSGGSFNTVRFTTVSPLQGVRTDSSVNDTAIMVNGSSCKTYGAMYNWATATGTNGRLPHTVNVQIPQTSIGQSDSVVRGICPEGWVLPSDADWGSALNTLEDGCNANFSSFGAAPCDHFRDNNTIAANPASTSSGSSFGSKSAVMNIKGTYSCPPNANTQVVWCATVDNPAWSWYRADYAGKVNPPLALGNDKYGFTALPGGWSRANSGKGTYSGVGYVAAWWTATVSSTANNVIIRAVYAKEDKIRRGVSPTATAKHHVRCIRQ